MTDSLPLSLTVKTWWGQGDGSPGAPAGPKSFSWRFPRWMGTGAPASISRPRSIRRRGPGWNSRNTVTIASASDLSSGDNDGRVGRQRGLALLRPRTQQGPELGDAGSRRGVEQQPVGLQCREPADRQDDSRHSDTAHRHLLPGSLSARRGRRPSSDPGLQR